VTSAEQCDLVRHKATDPRSAKSSIDLWESETFALFIPGSNITSRMKERLTQQLLDIELRSYLIDKEHWNAQHFESNEW
jgi:hypothetical protein